MTGGHTDPGGRPQRAVEPRVVDRPSLALGVQADRGDQRLAVGFDIEVVHNLLGDLSGRVAGLLRRGAATLGEARRYVDRFQVADAGAAWVMREAPVVQPPVSEGARDGRGARSSPQARTSPR